MKIDQEKKNDLHSIISITLEPDDYQPKVNEELKKLRQKSNFKGFRKGKTPMGFVRKMYGQNVLIDTVNKMVQDEIYNYINDQKLNILGYPIPSEDQKTYEFDVNTPESYELKFEVGLAPEVELVGVSSEDAYEWYKVEVPQDILDEEIELARKKAGKRKSMEKDIQEEDVIHIKAVELEGDDPKEKGWETDFTTTVSDLRDEYKDKLLGKDKGVEIKFDIFQLEKERPETYVRKYLLQMDEDDEGKEVGNMFSGVVIDIQRLVPAELDQNFFDKYFGEGKVGNLEEAQDFFRTEIEKFYSKQADELFFNQIYRKLMEINDFDLPEEFLWKYVSDTRQEGDPQPIREDVMKSYRWSILRDKLNKKFDIQVDAEDVKAGFRNRVANYLQGQMIDDAMMDGIIERMMENKEQVSKQADEVQLDKLFMALKNSVKLIEQPIGLEEFKELIAAENEKLNTADVNEEEE